MQHAHKVQATHNWIVGNHFLQNWRQAARFKNILTKSKFRLDLKQTFKAFKSLHEHKQNSKRKKAFTLVSL